MIPINYTIAISNSTMCSVSTKSVTAEADFFFVATQAVAVTQFVVH